VYKTIKQAKRGNEHYRLKNLSLSASIAITLSGTFYFNPVVMKDLIIRTFNLDNFAIADNTVNVNFFEQL